MIRPHLSMKGKSIPYVLVFLMLLGCSTSKNTWLSRSYHNLTAKYNVLFNGEQSFEKGREAMRASVRDDYTEILPLFAFSEATDADVPSSDMERAVRKGHKLIEEHSITAKPQRSPSGNDPEYREFYNQREFNRWVDDAWMLIGKAHAYSQEWYEAGRAFQEVLQTFPRKKVRFEAMLWLARTYIERDDFENALIHLERYSSEIKDERAYTGLAMSTYAWFWLSQGAHEEAFEYCRSAADNAGDRWQKIRWHFVLGQVAERTGDIEVARDAYQKVVRLNPDYDFSIHARIKKALLEGGPENPEKSRRELKNYAGEYKNRDYRDQIYYALAETWFWEGDTLNALTNLQLAAGYGEDNRALSGEIFRKMADVYFHSGDYIAADAYYDSTLNVLPDGHETLNELKARKKKLSPLAESLRTIQHEDSVQQIAALPEPEREQFIDDLLVRMEQEEEDRRFNKETPDAGFYQNFAGREDTGSGGSGKWYFYNQSTVSLGKMEFEKRWGERDLEDNWRRSGKRSQSADTGDDEDDMMPSDPFSQEPAGPEGEDESGADEESGVPDRETLIEGLPLSEEEMQASHQKLQAAVFNAANALSYNFDKQQEAVELYERLLRDYPQNRYREQILIGIYMACRESGNRECMDHYGQVITDDYPGSLFARYVNNPEHFDEHEIRQQEMETLYEQAYNNFKNEAWDDVFEKTEQIIAGEHDRLIPQAALLNALAYSQTGDNEKFRVQLERITENFPDSPQSRTAAHWLNLLEDGRQPEKINLASGETPEVDTDRDVKEEKESIPEEESGSRFVEEPDSLHYLMVLIDEKAETNQLMFHVANFNLDRYTTEWLQIETGRLGDDLKTLETGPFRGKQAGMNYFYSLVDNPSVFRVKDVGEPSLILVSESNREKLQTPDDVEAYKEFFLENYLPGSGLSAMVINESEIPPNSYMELREPEHTSVFTPNDEEVWGMILVSGEAGDIDEAHSFLPGVTRSVLRQRISVSEENLPGEQRVLLLKEFNELSDLEELSSSLEENSFWNSSVKGDDWELVPVSPDNFERLMEEEGDLEEYLEFVGM
ncbi:MAG: tetratricopeptide repeat protein [Marinilabilia sp.]